MEKIERDAEIIVEIAEGSGESFSTEIVEGIAGVISSGNYANDELIAFVNHVAKTIRGLNAWRVKQGYAEV